MSEEVVSVENHGLDGGIVDRAVGVYGKVLVLVPGVAHDKAAREVVGAVSIEYEVGAWDVSASDLNNVVDCGSSEEEILGLVELDDNVSLSEGNGSGGESVVEVAVEPEEEFLPYLPLGLFSLGSLETVEDLRSVSDTVANGNALSFKRKFLANVSEVTNLLVGL